MSNYAIQFTDDTSHATTGDMTDVKNATKLGFTLRLRGDRFTSQTDSQFRSILVAAAGYFTIGVEVLSGTVFVGYSSSADADTIYTAPGVAQSSFSASAYYRIRAYWDTSASPQQSIELYDDSGTLLDSKTTNVNTAISNGTFGEVRPNSDGTYGGRLANVGGLTVDWYAVWNGAPPAGSPSQPTVGTTGLLRLYPCDDGSGTTITESVDNSTGAATIVNGFTWILLSGGGIGFDDDSMFSAIPPTLTLPAPPPNIITVFG